MRGFLRRQHSEEGWSTRVDTTSTTVIVVTFGTFAVTLIAIVIQHVLRMQRLRFEYDREKDERQEARLEEAAARERRREELLEQQRLEQQLWSRTQVRSDNFHYFVDHLDQDPTAVNGDYITLKLNLGPQATAAEFADAVYSALQLPQNLAAADGREAEDIQVRVHRVSYENPMTVVLLLFGVAVVIAAVAAKVRQTNDEIQAIRTSASGASAQVAADKLQTKLLEQASTALDAAHADEREAILQNIRAVAHVVAEHNLLEMRTQQVGAGAEQPKGPAQLSAPPPPRELGAGPSAH